MHLRFSLRTLLVLTTLLALFLYFWVIMPTQTAAAFCPRQSTPRTTRPLTSSIGDTQRTLFANDGKTNAGASRPKLSLSRGPCPNSYAAVAT